MAEARTFKSLSLEAEHVPETHFTRDASGAPTEQELPGEVFVYLVIDGGRMLIDRLSASKVFEAIDTAAAAAPATESDTAADSGTSGPAETSDTTAAERGTSQGSPS